MSGLDEMAENLEAAIVNNLQKIAEAENNEEWQQAGKSKPRQQRQRQTNDNKERLSAIKFTISPALAKDFANPIKLTREVIRCHPAISAKAIKFASIRKNCIIIATDDNEAHTALNGSWPQDAFNYGIRKIG
jgi:hypothetical protein